MPTLALPTVLTHQFSHLILTWFDQCGRKDLPWQQPVSAYRVWISEIMLQQTQVSTVIGFFERFIQRFPTINSLAAAPIDDVLHLWSGLGYYARARHLHAAAQLIVSNYHGKLPSDLDQLQSLPGIGRSTAGAILALGYQKQAAILDGNVKRVLSRFHAIDMPPSTSTGLRQLWQLAEQYTPEQRVADYTQAMMDLGALVCTRGKPRCSDCPLTGSCLAYQTGTQSLYPIAKPRRELPIKAINMWLFYDLEAKTVLLEKRPPVGIWGGLWSFPESTIMLKLNDISQQYGLTTTKALQALPSFRHTFSHFHLDITAWLIPITKRTLTIEDNSSFIWYRLNGSETRGLAAPVTRLLQTLVEYCNTLA